MYLTWRLVAIAIGTIITGTDVYGTVEHLLLQEGGWTYIVLGGAIVTATAALLPSLAEYCLASGQRLKAIATWAIMLPAMGLVLTAAIDRAGSHRDRMDGVRAEHKQRVEIARSAVSDAVALVSSLETAAVVECATGRGENCRKKEAEAAAARREVAAARRTLADLGVAKEDPQARRIAAMFPWVTQEQVQLYQPLLLPILLSALGLLLLAIGLSPGKQKKAQPRPPAAPRKRKAVVKKGRAKKKPEAGPVREPVRKSEMPTMASKGQVIAFPRREDLEK